MTLKTPFESWQLSCRQRELIAAWNAAADSVGARLELERYMTGQWRAVVTVQPDPCTPGVRQVRLSAPRAEDLDKLVRAALCALVP